MSPRRTILHTPAAFLLLAGIWLVADLTAQQPAPAPQPSKRVEEEDTDAKPAKPAKMDDAKPEASKKDDKKKRVEEEDKDAKPAPAKTDDAKSEATKKDDKRKRVEEEEDAAP